MDAGFYIETATKDDAGPLAALATETFRQAYAIALPSGDLDTYLAQNFSVTRVEQDIADPASIVLLAKQAGSLGGYARLFPSPVPPEITGPKPVELSRLYVWPSLAGKGIGSDLLHAALAEAAKYYGCCWLRVWVKNSGALRFYQREGFVSMGEEPYVVGHSREPVQLMQRII